LVLLTIASGFAYSQNQFGPFPKCGFDLGYGVTLADPTINHGLPAITFTPSSPDTNAIDFDIDAQVVYDEQTLRDVLDIEAKVEARSLTWSGKSEFKYSTDEMFSHRALTIVLSANQDFQPVRAANIAPTESAKTKFNDIADIEHKNFYKDYGDEFVQMYGRGTRLHILITISNTSSEFRSKMRFQISGSAKLGVTNVGASIDVNKEIFRAKQNKQLRFTVVGSGGVGISAFDEALEKVFAASTLESNSIDSLIKPISKYVRSLRHTAAVPTWYKTVPYSQVFGSKPLDVWDELREENLKTAVQFYRSYSQFAKTIRTFIVPGNEDLRLMMTPKQLTEIPIVLGRLDAKLKELAEYHKRIRTDMNFIDPVPASIDYDFASLLPKDATFQVVNPGPWNLGLPDFDPYQIYFNHTWWNTVVPSLNPTIENTVQDAFLIVKENDERLFKLVDDIRIYYNGDEIISAKETLNTGRPFRLAKNKFYAGANCLDLSGFPKWYLIQNLLATQYRNVGEAFLNGEEREKIYDYQIGVVDVFGNTTYSNLYTYYYNKNTQNAVGQSTLPFILQSTSKVVDIRFDRPTMFGANDTLEFEVELTGTRPRPEDFPVGAPSYRLAASDLTRSADGGISLTIGNGLNPKGAVIYWWVTSPGVRTARPLDAKTISVSFKEPLGEHLEELVRN
jgi:hypothetical protein